MRHLIYVAVIAALASPVFADLCPACSDMMFTDVMSTASKCGHATTQGGKQYCTACSKKLGKCEVCGKVLAASVVPTTQPASRPTSQPATAAGSEKSQARFRELEKNVSGFVLEIRYYGQSDKPFYNLLLSVPEVKRARADAFSPACVISVEQALKIAAYLRDAGMLDSAWDTSLKDIKQPAGPCYVMTVHCGKLELWMDLGWGADMLKPLDGLRTVLENATSGKQLDTLIGRLSGLRKQWQADVAPK